MLRTSNGSRPANLAARRAGRPGGHRLLAGLLAALIGGGILAASPQQALAAPARSSAATPVAGVQDGWINSCAAGSEPRLPHPGSPVPAVESPYWSRLGMGTVRYSPPWDIAYHDTTSPDGQVLAVEQACFGYWLRDLAAHGVTPEIAFKPDYNYQSRGRIMIPDLRTYEAAISAFAALYSNCPGTPATCTAATPSIARPSGPFTPTPTSSGSSVPFSSTGR